jgi:mono/diheme cytochrome c family protein
MRKEVPQISFAGLAAMGVMTVVSVFAQEGDTLEKRGETLLTTNCSRCHSVGRAGNSPHSASPPFRTLSKKYPIDGLAEALAEGFSVGHPDMPEFVFEPDEIAGILAYLKSIQER